MLREMICNCNHVASFGYIATDEGDFGVTDEGVCIQSAFGEHRCNLLGCFLHEAPGEAGAADDWPKCRNGFSGSRQCSMKSRRGAWLSLRDRAIHSLGMDKGVSSLLRSWSFARVLMASENLAREVMVWP